MKADIVYLLLESNWHSFSLSLAVLGSGMFSCTFKILVQTGANAFYLIFKMCICACVCVELIFLSIHIQLHTYISLLSLLTYLWDAFHLPSTVMEKKKYSIFDMELSFRQDYWILNKYIPNVLKTPLVSCILGLGL